MNITVISSDSRSDKISLTKKITSAFLKGIEEKGGRTNIFYMNDLDIQECQGCTSDINFTPTEVCKINDSMQDLYKFFRESNIWIFILNFISPITYKNFHNLLDRLEPLFQPKTSRPGKIATIMTSDLDNQKQADTAIKQIKITADIFGKTLMTPILRKQFSLLEFLDRKNALKIEENNIFKAFEKLGSQVISCNDFDAETVKVASQIFEVPENFIEHYWKVELFDKNKIQKMLPS